MVSFIEISPHTNDTIKPIITNQMLKENTVLPSEKISKIVDAKIIGTLIKKEKSSTSSGLPPLKIPAHKVEPDREIPGNIATASNTPIINAVLYVNCAFGWYFFETIKAT